ncbi:MAG: two-component regulator propeller domain-containing protein [Chitinophagaceae bacterium]
MTLRVLYLLACFFFNRVFAAPVDNTLYQFGRIDISSGYSNNQINCIYKDKQGFMWFGTMSGLNRYDGYHFKIFKHSQQDTMTINDDFVTRIFEGPDDKLWIETRYGLNIYDPAAEKFDRDPSDFLKKSGIGNGAPATGIAKDSKGNFWFYGTDGLFLYEPKAKTTTAFTHKPNDNFSISAGGIAAFKEDGKGNLWILFQDGTLEMMEGISKKIFSRNSELRKVYSNAPIYYKLFIDADNDVWIYTANNPRGVVLFRPQLNTVEHFS